MPRPVVVSSPPMAVALEPNGDFGSLPSAAISLFLSGSCDGAFWKLALTGSSGMPGSLALGGVASVICGRKWPVEAIRLAR